MFQTDTAHVGSVQPVENASRDFSSRHYSSGPFGLNFDLFTAAQKDHIRIKDLPHSL